MSALSPTRTLALRVSLDVCADAHIFPTLGLIEALTDLFEGAFTRADLEVLCGITDPEPT
ncbi:hypothetical protein [Corynebacterium bouchesdurhonense]|uniref:hypothetical protein n=1 Tax=Corynebacterium bouchesdurhonense TaxID=1720192 RepID=UPI000ADB13AD|nr:hypothetical protein [Corynebacterium bouchesdurhonense]